MADNQYMDFMEEVISGGASDFILKPVLKSQITTLPSHVYKKKLQLKQQEKQAEVQQTFQMEQQKKFQEQQYMQSISHQLDQSKKFERPAEQNYGHQGSKISPYPVYNERGASNTLQTLANKRQDLNFSDKGNDNSWESSQYFVNPQNLRNVQTKGSDFIGTPVQFDQLAQSEQNDESTQDDRHPSEVKRLKGLYANQKQGDPYIDFISLLQQVEQQQKNIEQPSEQPQQAYWKTDNRNSSSYSPFQQLNQNSNQNQQPFPIELIQQLAQNFEAQQAQWTGQSQNYPIGQNQNQDSRSYYEEPNQYIKQKRQRSSLPKENEQTVTSSDQAQQTGTNRSIDKSQTDYAKNANCLPKGIQELIKQTERKLSGNHDFGIQNNQYDNSVQKVQSVQSRQLQSQDPEASLYQHGAFKLARNVTSSKQLPSNTGFQNSTFQSGEHSSSSEHQISTQNSNRQVGGQSAAAQDFIKHIQGLSQSEMMELGMQSMGQFIFQSMQQNFNNAVEKMSKNSNPLEQRASLDDPQIKSMFPQLALIHEHVQKQVAQTQRNKLQDKEKPQSVHPIQAVDQEMNGEIMAELRKVALQKYIEKRKRRTYDKKVRYESRRTLAVNRPRVRGQFVKIDDLAKMQIDDSDKYGQSERNTQYNDYEQTVAS